MLTQLRISERPPTHEEQEILDMEPPLDELGVLVLECWCANEGERYPGFSATGPIPPHCVRDWCRDEGCDRELTRIVTDAIRYCDSQRAERISSELAHKG